MLGSGMHLELKDISGVILCRSPNQTQGPRGSQSGDMAILTFFRGFMRAHG